MPAPVYAGSGIQPVAIPEEDEEEDQEEEATVKLMLIVLGEDAIKGFHQQVIATMHPSHTCSQQTYRAQCMHARHKQHVRA